MTITQLLFRASHFFRREHKITIYNTAHADIERKIYIWNQSVIHKDVTWHPATPGLLCLAETDSKMIMTAFPLVCLMYHGKPGVNYIHRKKDYAREPFSWI